mgnify:CR=1 FL=1
MYYLLLCLQDTIEPYAKQLKPHIQVILYEINHACRGLEPWQIIAFTFGVTLILTWIYDFLFQEESKMYIHVLVY